MGNHQSYIIVWVTLRRFYFFVYFFLGGGAALFNKKRRSARFLAIIATWGTHSGISFGPGKRGHFDERFWPRREG